MLFEEDIEMTEFVTPEKENLIQLTPEIYKEYRDSNPFNLTKFFLVLFAGIAHSFLIYFIPLIIYQFQAVNSNGMVILTYIFRLLDIGTIVYAVFSL